jgi:hypothetical protein
MRWILLAGLVLFSLGVNAQTSFRATVSGRVLDAETNAPVADANVFLANTGCGTTTASDGIFRLGNIPPGSYVIVVSRVGYLRDTQPIAPTARDSISLTVRLTPRSIPVGGPDILAEREQSHDLGGDLFFPQSMDNAFCLYGSEVSYPVGILITDSALFMYAVEPTVIDNERFYRLWLLIYNITDVPVDFDAMRGVRLTVRNSAATYADIAPTQPDATLPEVQDSVTARIVSRTIGTTLEVVSRQREFFIGRNTDFDLMNGGPWAGKNSPADFVAGINPTHLLRIYTACTYGGSLKRYRVSPASGVHGFLYFLAPGLNWVGSSRPAPVSTTIEVAIHTPSGRKTIAFHGHF